MVKQQYLTKNHHGTRIFDFTCFPRIIRLGFSCSVILAKSLATARGWSPSYSLSFNTTWMPRSAPMASAVRRVSCEVTLGKGKVIFEPIWKTILGLILDVIVWETKSIQCYNLPLGRGLDSCMKGMGMLVVSLLGVPISDFWSPLGSSFKTLLTR